MGEAVYIETSIPSSCRRKKPMYQDEVIAEVWHNRDSYVKEHHGSLDEILIDLQCRQEKRRDSLVDRRSDKRAQLAAGCQG